MNVLRRFSVLIIGVAAALFAVAPALAQTSGKHPNIIDHGR
jgi:hypothetical protein